MSLLSQESKRSIIIFLLCIPFGIIAVFISFGVGVDFEDPSIPHMMLLAFMASIFLYSVNKLLGHKEPKRKNYNHSYCPAKRAIKTSKTKSAESPQGQEEVKFMELGIFGKIWYLLQTGLRLIVFLPILLLGIVFWGIYVLPFGLTVWLLGVLYRRYTMKKAMRQVFLIAHKRRGWYPFIINNVLPSLPQRVMFYWNCDKPEMFIDLVGVPKPYMVRVADDGFRVLSLNCALQELKKHGARNEKVQAQAFEIISYVVGEMA